MPRDGPISILPWDEQMGAGGRCALIPRMRLLWLSWARFRPRGGGVPLCGRSQQRRTCVSSAGSRTQGVWSLESGGSCLSGSGPEAKSSLPPGLCELPCAHF